MSIRRIPENAPDAIELAEIQAEIDADTRKRVREAIAEATPEKWEQQNRESIERGWGPLPF